MRWRSSTTTLSAAWRTSGTRVGTRRLLIYSVAEQEEGALAGQSGYRKLVHALGRILALERMRLVPLDGVLEGHLVGVPLDVARVVSGGDVKVLARGDSRGPRRDSGG